MKFDPNATGVASAGIFALPFSKEEADLILLPVPWEVTTSYGSGTSLGPESIYTCSRQIDLTHMDTGTAYERGIFWDDTQLAAWKKINNELKPLAKKITTELENGEDLPAEFIQMQKRINTEGEKIHQEVYQITKDLLNQGKMVGLVGGDHSAPFGAIQAISEKYKGDFTIIHIDAHADLRKSYQGYQHSHASIMRNVMESPRAPKKLIQLGIRDFCPEEYNFIQERPDITTFFDRDVKRRLFKGDNWHSICDAILKEIPTENIYFSFDIDGLNPYLCENTGTPVPGGLEFEEATELMNYLITHKKKIIGFDLCEVTPTSAEELDCWDGNVGSRMLYNLSCYALYSNR
jgi:agmatinase